MNQLLKKAGKKTTTTASKSAVKTVAGTTDDVVKAVDGLIANKASLATLTAEKGILEQTILDHVTPQYESLGRDGKFTKSLVVNGSEGKKVTYSRSDRFSVPQDEDTQTEIKGVIGEETFDELFESVSTVAIKSDVLTNDKVINKMVKACEKAGLEIADLFETTTKVIAKKELDKNQFTLSEEDHELFKALVKQNKASLKI